LSEVDIKVNFEDIRLSGKLDAVIINREDQTAIIRDYKTGKSKERIEDKYKNQLYLYKLLLDLAPERLPKDIKLKGAELVYINASDDEVKTLSLDYNESEYEEFKKLIKQVWQEIMHLGQK
jgi:RecB family exonuclease